MYSFPLEEEKEIGVDNISTDSKTDKTPYIQPIPIILGAILFLVVLLDMILLFLIPYQKIQTNKRKLPEATFKKPSTLVIVFHFILHGMILIIGILIILLGFREYKQIDHIGVIVSLIIIGSLTFIFYLIVLGIDFTSIPSIYSQMTIDELISLISRNPPINFAFVYSKCEEEYVWCTPTCTIMTNTYYSKNGIIIPIKTNITSSIYNFTNTPEMFYFVVQQNVNMSFNLIPYFDGILADANSCDSDSQQKVEFYPIIHGDYIVAKKKIPTYLSKATRITSILFGVGVYYELNFKSVPYNICSKFKCRYCSRY